MTWIDGPPMTSYSFVVEGKPAVKKRPRMTRSGRTYTPQETVVAETYLGDQYQGPKFMGPIKLEIEYAKDHQTVTITELPEYENQSKLRGDLDNYVKLTLDALNKIAFNDDAQVKEIVARKL